MKAFCMKLQEKLQVALTEQEAQATPVWRKFQVAVLWRQLVPGTWFQVEVLARWRHPVSSPRYIAPCNSSSRTDPLFLSYQHSTLWIDRHGGTSDLCKSSKLGYGVGWAGFTRELATI